MRSFIKTIFRFCLGTKSDGQLTNKDLEDLIIDSFKEGISRFSLRNKVLYPTDFTIMLHSDNFKEFYPSFAGIMEDCVTEFIKILNKRMKGVPQELYTNNWRFLFAECTENAQIKQTSDRVEKNKPLIIYGLVPTAGGGSNGGGTHYVNTVNGPTSKLADHIAINEASLGVTYLGSNTFEMPIRLDFDQQAVSPIAAILRWIKKKTQGSSQAAAQKPNVYGHLSISGKSYVGGRTSVELQSPVILVCGRVGLRSVRGQQVICIDDVNVGNPHLMIERSGNSYKITTYADIRLNGVEIKKNKNKELPANSDIIINNEINLKFILNN